MRRVLATPRVQLHTGVMSLSSHSAAPVAALHPAEWRVNNFDLIRLLAALQVAIVHIVSYLRPSDPVLARVGFGLGLFPGVPVFFLISGFLIARSLEQSTSLKAYYRNRCLRIYPALWICLLVTVGIILACGVRAIGVASSTDWLIWWADNMIGLESYRAAFLDSIGTGQINGSLWTIPVELEFYLLLPGIYSLLRLREHRRNAPLVILLIVSAAIRLGCVNGAPLSRIGASSLLLPTVIPYLWMFLVGVLAQRNWPAIRHWLAGRFHWWLLGYLLARAVAAHWHIGSGGVEINPAFYVLLTGVVLSGAMSARSLSNRLLRRNDISYGTYIYHMPVVNLMLQYAAAPSVSSVAMALAASLALAAASWRLVEKPFLAQKHGSMRELAVSPAAAAHGTTSSMRQ
jgi:peptidoglycan/LPS O-acetylase OafA/YrhL